MCSRTDQPALVSRSPSGSSCSATQVPELLWGWMGLQLCVPGTLDLCNARNRDRREIGFLSWAQYFMWGGVGFGLCVSLTKIKWIRNAAQTWMETRCAKRLGDISDFSVGVVFSFSWYSDYSFVEYIQILNISRVIMHSALTPAHDTVTTGSVLLITV